ncbi:RNA polymerase sigma factor [Singulisphaera sp. PoT]|uniref:RNA polymerase sigma factor n=1 Tax=Singulisphaera sp. PoT TaxID=3411797 RepID=UPI003BF48B33
MRSVKNGKTRASLLGRLHRNPDDPELWKEFVRHYGPSIYAWALRWGVQDADAEDVVQAVLMKLALKLREFVFDPSRSFRGWLKTLAHNAWRDQADRHAGRDRGSGDDAVLLMLDRAEARKSLAECLEESFDLELFREAMDRVRLRVEPKTWEAFRLLAFDGWSGLDAARHLGMKPATVFVARSKVQRMLRDVVAMLERGEWDSAPSI